MCDASVYIDMLAGRMIVEFSLRIKKRIYVYILPLDVVCDT